MSSTSARAATITGSLPRPTWYSENLGTRTFRDALADARAKADQAAAAEMQKMSAGLPLPPGFKMPF